MKNSRLHLFVKGRVQGVFFRAWTKERADGLGLTGFARNLEDGRVEIVAEGARDILGTFLALINKGPKLSRVSHVSVVWKEPTGEFGHFEVI